MALAAGAGGIAIIARGALAIAALDIPIMAAIAASVLAIRIIAAMDMAIRTAAIRYPSYYGGYGYGCYNTVTPGTVMPGTTVGYPAYRTGVYAASPVQAPTGIPTAGRRARNCCGGAGQAGDGTRELRHCSADGALRCKGSLG